MPSNHNQGRHDPHQGQRFHLDGEGRAHLGVVRGLGKPSHLKIIFINWDSLAWSHLAVWDSSLSWGSWVGPRKNPQGAHFLAVWFQSSPLLLNILPFCLRRGSEQGKDCKPKWILNGRWQLMGPPTLGSSVLSPQFHLSGPLFKPCQPWKYRRTKNHPKVISLNPKELQDAEENPSACLRYCVLSLLSHWILVSLFHLDRQASCPDSLPTVY